jgi:DNA-binding NarL/FixJ family response regulator
MDLGLPGKSGIEGIARVQSQSPATKVIVLTIHEEDEKVFEAICAGASGYLLKPSPPEQIVGAIREVRRGAAPINGYIARRMLSMFSRLTPPKPSADDYHLTEREKEILQLLVDGLTMKQIAVELILSYHTVGNHLRNIYHKLHVRSRSTAVAKALKEELV